MFNKQFLKLPISIIITIILTLGITLSFQNILADWVAPSANPPAGNLNELFNTSDVPQSKDAGIILNHLGATANGLIVEHGNVGIGTTIPGSTLDVAGNMGLTGDMNMTGDFSITGDLTISGTVDGVDISADLPTLSGNETITGNWVNTANPWSDNEVSNTLTIDTTGSVAKGAIANSGTLGFDWVNSEIADNLTISSSGSVDGGAVKTGTVDSNRVEYGSYFITSAGTDGYVWRSDGSGRGDWTRGCYFVQIDTFSPGNTLTFSCYTGDVLIQVTDSNGEWANPAAMPTYGTMFCCPLEVY